MCGCPFYGFHWPDRSPLLHYVGGKECGLDIDHNCSCCMEAHSLTVDYFVCFLVREQWGMIQAAKHLIAFDNGLGRPQLLEEWEQQRTHSGKPAL